MRKQMIEEIQNLKNPYPKDIFVWDNPEKCDFTRGRFNQFIFQGVEDTKLKIIDLLEDLGEVRQLEQDKSKLRCRCGKETENLNPHCSGQKYYCSYECMMEGRKRWKEKKDR